MNIVPEQDYNNVMSSIPCECYFPLDVILFLFIYLSWGQWGEVRVGVRSKGFAGLFLLQLLLHCELRTNVRVLCVYSNSVFRNQGNNHQVGGETQWTHCETDLSEDSIYYLNSAYVYSNEGLVMVLWIPGYPHELRPYILRPSKIHNISKEITINCFGEGLKKFEYI